MEPLKDRLYKSFKSYIEYATSYFRLRLLKEKQMDEKIYIAYFDHPSWLRSIIERAENSKEFNNLVLNFSVALGRKPKKLDIDSEVSVEEHRAIKTFFRRSKFYLKMSEERPINIDNFFERLWSAFDERQVKITKLHLLEYVYFAEDLIDFGKFKIQKFSEAELDVLFDNQLNHIFYPNAELEKEELNLLSNYWFIVEESYIKKKFNETVSESLAFPKKIIQSLILFDWSELCQFGIGFQIPISLPITDDIFTTPSPSPDLSVLDLEPVYDNDGNQIDEAPATYFIIDKKDEIEKLKEIVKNFQNFVENCDLEQCNWQFIEIALDYLEKAFFLNDDKEKILWNMVVFEALFGEKNQTLESIRGRLCNIFGKTEKEKESIKKTFTKLYEFRSDLVHCKKRNKKYIIFSSREARKFARDSMVWFLSYLSTIHSELSKKQIALKDYPQRRELLLPLDFKKGEWKKISFLAERLPTNIWGN